MYFPKGSKSGEKYQGNRDVDSFAAFLEPKL
jgi:hypothetical protein